MLPRRNNQTKIRRLGLNRKKFIYSAKSYNNPFFGHRQSAIKSGASPISGKLIAAALTIVVIVLIWLIFFSSLFKIKDIVVNGVDENIAMEVKTLAYDISQNGLLSKNNLLFFNKSALTESLNEKYYLSELTIKRKLFHTLSITLKQEQEAAAWLEDSKYYLIDGDGQIISQIDPLNINRQVMPLIENLTSTKIDDRQANINTTTITYITNLFQEFKEQKHGFEIEKFVVDDSANTVKMSILGGPRIFFNTADDIVKQAEELDLVVREKLKDNFKNKEYIDLRFGNNVYIK